jgi:hypothetical protein
MFLMFFSHQVSLSESAEVILEKTMAGENHEDVIYYWVPIDTDQTSNFWSTCDCLNAGHCRCLECLTCYRLCFSNLPLSLGSRARNHFPNHFILHGLVLRFPFL